MAMPGELLGRRKRGRPRVWREPYVQTTVRITDRRMRWLEKHLLKSPGHTPTFLINTAIDQLMRKENEDRPMTGAEVVAYLAEKRKADAELAWIVGEAPPESTPGPGKGSG